MAAADQAAGGVALRSLTSAADYAACVEVQRATWGRDFAEVVPASILKVARQVGGVSAGAFDPEGRMLGFVFGLTGVRAGRASGAAGNHHDTRLVHWSHMLAVMPEARDLGLGRRLKLYQRELLLPLEVETVLWTFDPLEARNAHLNLNRLGAGIEEYVEDMYANEMGSELARGIGTDRFIVAWPIADVRVARALAGEVTDAAPFSAAPVVNEEGSALDGVDLPGLPRVRVEVPASIQSLKAESPEAARAWRAGTRRALAGYLERGYRVAAFYRDAESGRCFYCLEA